MIRCCHSISLAEGGLHHGGRSVLLFKREPAYIVIQCAGQFFSEQQCFCCCQETATTEINTDGRECAVAAVGKCLHKILLPVYDTVETMDRVISDGELPFTVEIKTFKCAELLEI